MPLHSLRRHSHFVPRLLPLGLSGRSPRVPFRPELKRPKHPSGPRRLTTRLCSCLALPKISYILCTCPPCHIRQASTEFDKSIRGTLESITGGLLSDRSWQKAGSLRGLPPSWPLRQALHAVWSRLWATSSLHLLSQPAQLPLSPQPPPVPTGRV